MNFGGEVFDGCFDQVSAALTILIRAVTDLRVRTSDGPRL
jgi:hypothetical protein